MIVRISFELDIPFDTLAGTVQAAAVAAACVAENTVERAHEDNKSAVAGPVRITIVTNKPPKKGHR